MGKVRITGNKEGMVKMEKERRGCLRNGWEEEGWGTLEGKEDGYR